MQDTTSVKIIVRAYRISERQKIGVINFPNRGTTTETALAFRLLKKQCEDQRGKEMAKKVIVAVTDAKKGAARVTADNEGLQIFHYPDNVWAPVSPYSPR